MNLVQTTQFRKDVRRLRRRGKDLRKLMGVIDLLVSGADLPESLRDHALTWPWRGLRDCHVEPDWLLIYKPLDESLMLGRTGTHADLF